MDSRFEGSPGFMQGGFLAGVTTGPDRGPRRVQIRRPVLPGDELTVIVGTDGRRQAVVNGDVVMTAFADPLRVDEPTPLDPAEADAALALPLPWPKPFPACVGCGDNADGLGSEIRLLGNHIVAEWTPGPDVVDTSADAGIKTGDKAVGHEAVWTVVDCFTSWAIFADPPDDRSGVYVTGNIALELREPLTAGIRYVMHSWKERVVPPGRKEEGRFKLGSIIVGGSIQDPSGRIVALADQELVRSEGFGMDLTTMGVSKDG